MNEMHALHMHALHIDHQWLLYHPQPQRVRKKQVMPRLIIHPSNGKCCLHLLPFRFFSS